MLATTAWEGEGSVVPLNSFVAKRMCECDGIAKVELGQ
jgi:hypothetical protein